MLKRYFLSNILFVLFANVLIKPIWLFGIDRNVQLLLGHNIYGSYTAILGLSVVFAIMLDMGVTNYNNLLVAGDKNRIHASLPNLLLVKVVLSLLYFGVLCVLAWILDYSAEAFKLLFLVCSAQILASLVIYMRSNISANHDFKTDALLAITDKVIMILTCSLWLFGFIAKNTFTIYVFVALQIMAYLITLILCFLFIRKNYTRISLKEISSEHTINLFKKGFPYAVLIFLMGIYMRGDAVILERMAGAKETGLFANAFRILDVSNTLGVLVAGVLLPMFSRLIHQQQKLIELVRVSSNLLMPAVLAITIFCGMHAHHLMSWLYKDTSGYTARLFTFTMLSFPAYSLQYIFSTLLTAKQSLALLIRIALVGCALSLVCNFFLVHSFAALGTAMAAMIVQWTLAGLSCYFAYKQCSLVYSRMLILRYGLFVLLLLGANLLLAQQQGSLWLSCTVNLFLVPILFFGIGFFKLQSLRAYFTSGS